MPFERYLSQPASSSSSQDRYEQYPATHHDASLGIDASTFSTNVQFQVPRLMYPAPTLAPGGGAEVLPPGLIPSSGPVTSWFAHSGYRCSDDFSSTSSCSSYQQPISQQLFSAPAYALPSDLHSYSHPDTDDSPGHSPPNAIPSCSSTPYSFPVQPPPRTPIMLSPTLQLPHDARSLLEGQFLTIRPQFPVLPNMPLSVPSAMGLPVYSVSGFDLLSILSRVATRPHPNIHLGPVDMTCSFVVVDVRRYDSPIVYASPTFCKLTGYDEREVLGRNCRFLQSPDGRLQRGEPRRYTAPEAVSHLKRCLVADKECQTSIINYRKGGAAFINLLTVIPIAGGVNNTPEEADDVVYHVGFQVDLTEQPNAILQKLRDGSYIVDYSRKPHISSFPPGSSGARDWRSNSASMSGVSPELRTLLADQAFVQSIPITTSTTVSSALGSGEKLDLFDGNKPLHMFLLECAPDFIHVVSLKGAFLYVAPTVRRVLGFSPDELVGRTLTEFCHPADVIPLMRELKESSITPGPGSSHLPAPTSDAQTGPRSVDLLFRMRAKSRDFVWLECRGRLHVEPGKGRKAIILSGRLRSMPRLDWGPVERAGGLLAPTPSSPRGAPSLAGSDDSRGHGEREREFWALLSTSGTCLFVGAAVRDVLGWGAGEVIGKALGDFVGGSAAEDARRALADELARALAAGAQSEQAHTRGVSVELKRKDGMYVVAHITLYRWQDSSDVLAPEVAWDAAALPQAPPCPVVCQVKLRDAASSSSLSSMAATPARIVHPLEESVFDELQIARASSWQYELQQLKYANQRIQEEVATLEASLRTKTRQRSASQNTQRTNSSVEQQQQQHPQPTQRLQQPLQVPQHQMQQLQHSPPLQHQQHERYLPHPQHPQLQLENTQNWSMSYAQYPETSTPIQHVAPQSLKRSWHAIDGAPT